MEPRDLTASARYETLARMRETRPRFCSGSTLPQSVGRDMEGSERAAAGGVLLPRSPGENRQNSLKKKKMPFSHQSPRFQKSPTCGSVTVGGK